MSKHVVVIGGGVIGLSAAAECVKRGHRVTVIDRDPRNRGSSLGNAGMIVPSHFVPLAAPGMIALGLKWMANPESPFYIKPRLNWELFTWAMRFWRAGTAEHVKRCAPILRDLHLASRESYSRLADSGEQLGLKKNGLLMLCKTQKGLDEESHTAIAAQRLGIAATVLDAKQLAALDPTVTMDVQGGIHYPGDCHLDPQRYVQSREDFLRRSDCQLLYQVEITGWKLDGNRIAAVRTASGEIAGDEFVLAGGTWSSDLSRKLGLSLP
ncbi:MAG TPA: FAD-dependent oxidoreductase, partial [Planctomycetaceae bacterium]|nr:FAD-dependent oxidoreductase [Planctomycetaceae bacterium]